MHLSAGMSRTYTVCIAALLFGTACARQVGTTAVTSAAASSAAQTPGDAAALRLADELCGREAACSNVGQGARYRTEEACLSDQSSRAPLQLARWSCTPSQTQDGFEQCLAAIRSERCETTLTHVEQLAACRRVAVCGR
jgi:Family of unknown function (DUF6184)